MSSQKTRKTNTSDNTLKVIDGKKSHIKIKRIISVCSVLAIIIILLIINAVTPTGIVEYIQNSFEARGSVSNKQIFFTEENLDVRCQNNSVFCLNKSCLEVYSKSGNNLLSVQHGFSNPAMSLADTRALIYERGKTGYKILSNSAVLFESKSEQNIIAGNIARNGNYALVTYSESYVSQVTVYNKNNNSIYKWFSAKYLITDAVLNDSGNRLAVSVIYSDNGSLKSEIYVFKFDSVSSLYTLNVDGPINVMKQINNQFFAAVGEKDSYCIKWDGSGKTNIVENEEIKYYSASKNSFSVVTGGSNSMNINNVYLFSVDKNSVNEFSVENSVDSVAVSDKSLFCLSDDNILCYNFDGKLINNIQTNKLNKRIACLNDKIIVAVSDLYMEVVLNNY